MAISSIAVRFITGPIDIEYLGFSMLSYIFVVELHSRRFPRRLFEPPRNDKLDKWCRNQDLAENKMHKVFGVKENTEYLDREGAYFIPFRNKEVGVVQTPKGYFFLGGGLENGESHVECIERECCEEVGYAPYIKGRLCSAEAYIEHPTIGYFHPMQTYYFGTLLDRESEPIEAEHVLCWIECDQLKGNMFVEMQNWALAQLSSVL